MIPPPAVPTGRNGWHEGRNPNAWFDTAGYPAHHADVAAAGVNPLAHYEQYGWLEGRDPSGGIRHARLSRGKPGCGGGEYQSARPLHQYGTYDGRMVFNDGIRH